MKIYTDGATSNNGYSNAIGGWAFIIIDDKENILHSEFGKVIGVTNQQMELMALINGCEYAYNKLSKKEYNENSPFAIGETEFEIYTDSAYIINCNSQSWWRKWINNGWLNSKKQPVANQELWEKVIPYFLHPCFSFLKVKGHSVDKWNNYVDELAVKARMS